MDPDVLLTFFAKHFKVADSCAGIALLDVSRVSHTLFTTEDAPFEHLRQTETYPTEIYPSPSPDEPFPYVPYATQHDSPTAFEGAALALHILQSTRLVTRDCYSLQIRTGAKTCEFHTPGGFMIRHRIGVMLS